MPLKVGTAFLVLFLAISLPLSIWIANSTGDPMRFGAVLIVLIGLAMVFGSIFADWASGPPK